MGHALKSLKVAAQKRLDSQKIRKAGLPDQAYTTLYSCMFHASRALLFKDGYKEKSHYAVYIYVNEKYSDKLPNRFLTEFNVMRLDRHEILYGLDAFHPDEENLGKLMTLAQEYIKAVGKLIA